MAESKVTISIAELRDVLISWLKPHLDEEGLKWVQQTSNSLAEGAEDWEFFSSFSAVPRYTGKESLSLDEQQKLKAEEIRSGWKPEYWSLDQLGRTLMVLSIADEEKSTFLNRLDKTFVSSDMGEATALYQALPILPWPEELTERAAEGIRSNMTSAFNAVAHHNPYPADYFDDGAWNQMVLKALFVQSPLYKIQGLDLRVNQKLANMLVDYAHERWAAGRTVSPELWRPVGPFASGDILKDLQKVLNNEDELQQQAAALALSASSDEEAQQLLEKHQTTLDAVMEQNITWDEIGERSQKYRQ